MGLPETDVPEMSDAVCADKLEQQQFVPVDGAEAFLQRVSEHGCRCAWSPTGLPRSAAFAHGSFRPCAAISRDVLVSEDFAHAKPHPEMLMEALRLMNVTDPRQAVMIGDNENTDILAAKSAGVQSILFTNGGPLPEHTNADKTAATLAEAADWILS